MGTRETKATIPELGRLPMHIPILAPLASTFGFTGRCNGMSFVLASDPEEDPSDLVLCPSMERLILYTGDDRVGKIHRR